MVNEQNRWSGFGRLVNDPEMIGEINDTTRIATFSLSNRRIHKDKEHVNYFNCKSYSGLADLIMRYCRKGDPVLIDGALEHKSWVAKNGKKRQSVEIVILNIQFLTIKKLKEKEDQKDFDILDY